MPAAAIKRIQTSVLDVAYEESGAADGVPVLLLHGWPYDPRCYDDVVPLLTAKGCRIIVPYLRGFGPTRFRSAATPRSGQQAALGNDLRELMDALAIKRAVLAGYDWGGRAACIVAALWPERAIAAGHRQQLQYSEYPRGDEAGCAGAGASALVSVLFSQRARPRRAYRRTAVRSAACCGHCGRRCWTFDEATFERSAVSFDNPDFVAVTIQSYRHRLRLCGRGSGAGSDRAAARRPA